MVIAGSLIRDVAALNKTELLPWDVWRAQPQINATLSADELILGDHLAGLTTDPDRHFLALRAHYAEDHRVRWLVGSSMP